MELLYGVTDIDLSGVLVGVPEEFAVADLAEGFDRLGQGLGPVLVVLVLDDAIPRVDGVGVVAFEGADVDAIRFLLAAPSGGVVERADAHIAHTHVAAVNSVQDFVV